MVSISPITSTSAGSLGTSGKNKSALPPSFPVLAPSASTAIGFRATKGQPSVAAKVSSMTGNKI